MTFQKINNNQTTKNKKVRKTGIVFVVILGLICLSWYVSKPFRMIWAESYLDRGRTIDILKASVLNPTSFKVHLRLGNVYFVQQEYQKAQQEYQKALSYCKNCPESSEILFQIKKLSIFQALKAGELEKARDLLAEGLELYSAEPETQFYYGIFLTAQGDYSEASKALQFATENESLEKQRRLLLSALEKINSANYNSYQNPYSQFLIGAVFLNMGYENLAILLFDKMTKIEPDFRDAYIYLAKAHLKRAERNSQEADRDLNKAKEALEKASKIDPIYPETFYLLSRVYDKLKKPAESQKTMEKAIALGWKE